MEERAGLEPAFRLIAGLLLAQPPGFSRFNDMDAVSITVPKWQGQMDLNHRVTGSKPVAFPLGYTPAK